MKRGKPLARRTAMRKVRHDRIRALRALQFGAQAELCRSLPCCSCGCVGQSQAHHEPTRAAGGTDLDTVPLCPTCHSLRHTVGRATFWRNASIDPEKLKNKLRHQVNLAKARGAA
jgi:hypothetical protein